MTRRSRREVFCECGQSFWVEENDPRLPDGPFACGTCDIAQWTSVAIFTGPAEMILVEEGGGSTLLDVLDSFRDERIRVVVYQRKRQGIEIN
jgi:hypothetical protein